MSNSKTQTNSRLLSTKRLSDELDVPERTLADWRVTGDGPKFHRLTPRCVRYAWADVMEWLESRRFDHTAQADGAC
ncbi:phage transcriptional regulator, AlpA [Salinisphaera shabanensis T35B1]|uniref:helix-turn-helix transcriptional regulator n=1 Tax=Salinisphaera shabanensis TaxID=180542 RepID=UPI00333F85D0